MHLKSSPIDELGGGAYKRRWRQAKYEQLAERVSIHGNPESGNHPGTITMIESVEILTTLILNMTIRREGEGEGEGMKEKHAISRFNDQHNYTSHS